MRDWVIISSERAKRPNDFKKPAKSGEPIPEVRSDCPFCPGNEGDFKDEVFRLGDGKAWRTRAIYNKFPALSDTVKEERRMDGYYRHISGYGVHEVIIENPRHNACIPLMTDGEVCDIIRTYKARYSAIQGRPGIQAITIFKNHGPAAGCSKEHPHSQLVATPVVPHRIRSIVENAVEYYDVNNKCMFCQGIELELKEKKRLVLETDKFVSFMPYAGVAPFVMMICPKRHVPSFDAIDEGEIKDLARILKTTLAKLYHGLNDPDFNYTIRSVPVKEKWNEAFHWSISVIPRLTNPAGFELGSGMFINASIPEEGAEFLRNQKA